MGGWKMEVTKMFIYLSFPVSCFYYFNHPQYYESSLNKMRKAFESEYSKAAAIDIEKSVKDYEKSIQQQQLQSLEKGKSMFQ